MVHTDYKYVILIRPEALWPILAGQGHWEIDPGDVAGPVTVAYRCHLYSHVYSPPGTWMQPKKGFDMGSVAIFEGIHAGSSYVVVGRNDLHLGPVEVLGAIYVPPPTEDESLVEIHVWNKCKGDMECTDDPLCNCMGIRNQTSSWIPGLLFYDKVKPYFESLGTVGGSYVLHEEEMTVVLEKMVGVERDKQSDAVAEGHWDYVAWDEWRRQ